MLSTRTISFSHNVFFTIKEKFQCLVTFHLSTNAVNLDKSEIVVKDNSPMSLMWYLKNRVTYFVQNQRK